MCQLDIQETGWRVGPSAAKKETVPVEVLMRQSPGLFVLLASITLVSSPGRAQELGHAAFVLGWTFGEETSPLYGAQFGAGLGGNFSIVGGIERLDDILTGRYELFLAEIADRPGVDVAADIPATYYGAGLRWTVPGLGVSPFVQAQFGATSVSPEITFTVNGEDVTDEVLSPGELDETAFTFALGGGLRGNVGDRFLVEVAFQFFDVRTGQEISINRLSFAVGARF
jgi:opacity protein-like surface antigen